MAQHHLRRQNNGAWVDFILARIFRRSPVSRFKQRAFVADIRTRCNTDTANLSRQGIGNIVTVQVHTGDNVVFRRTQQDLLQERIGDNVFNHDLFTRVRVLNFQPRTAVNKLTAELVARQLVAPVFKRAFGELHDIAFMYQRDGIAIVGNSVFNRRANQTFSAFFRTRFDTDTAVLREANFLHAHLFAQELDHFLSVCRVSFPFNSGVDVFRVFTEDDHIGQLRMFHRTWRALIVTNGTQTNVQVKLLTQGNVQRADTAANRRGQWTFNRYAVVTN